MFPVDQQCEWRSIEGKSVGLWKSQLGTPDLPSVLVPVRDKMQIRTVFGLGGLREKLILHDANISDVDLELLKLCIHKSGHKKHLLFEHCDDKTLTFRTGADEFLSVSRNQLDSLREHQSSFRSLVGAGPFVDVRRIISPM